jgi:hypothetical protein
MNYIPENFVILGPEKILRAVVKKEDTLSRTLLSRSNMLNFQVIVIIIMHLTLPLLAL